MSERKLPVRPNLDQLKHQAKDFLRAIRKGDASANAEFNQFHPEPIRANESDTSVTAGGTPAVPVKIKLADAQLALARSYGAANWPRLVQACNLIDAIWRDDVAAVRELVLQNPKLLY